MKLCNKANYNLTTGAFAYSVEEKKVYLKYNLAYSKGKCSSRSSLCAAASAAVVSLSVAIAMNV
jgi:hypothetical protein